MERKRRRKNRLYGEALEYPDFAILDFSELLKERKKDNGGKAKIGDRLSFSCIEYGYEGFVFKPENLSKIIDWYKEQKIPQKDIKILRLKSITFKFVGSKVFQKMKLKNF